MNNTIKQNDKNLNTLKKMDELSAKHREIKSDMMVLFEKFGSPNYSKETLKGELFKIYMKVK